MVCQTQGCGRRGLKGLGGWYSARTAEGRSHEIPLGLCGGSVTSGIASPSEGDRFHPLLFISNGFGKKYFAGSAEPAAVFFGDGDSVRVFDSDKCV